MFIWVRDVATGHRFDVPEGDVRIKDGRLKPINDKRYPPAKVARRPKHNINPRQGTKDKES